MTRDGRVRRWSVCDLDEAFTEQGLEGHCDDRAFVERSIVAINAQNKKSLIIDRINAFH